MSFRQGDRNHGANIGTPDVHNLLVRDPTQLYWMPPEIGEPASPSTPRNLLTGGGRDFTKPLQCPSCQRPIGGAILEIRDDVFTRAWIYLPGEFDQRTDYYLIDPHGSLTPMPAWSFHSMDDMQDC